MIKSLIVIDDFYVEPDKIRDVALRSEFCVTGNYPGQRTKPFLNDYVKEKIEAAVQHPVLDWTADSANGSFQYTTCRDRTWIHADHTNNWAGVIYLTPNAPPSSGTGFYRHIETGCHYYPDDETLGRLCDQDSQDYTKWVKLDTVANVYNRLILFAANRFHASQDYFGTKLGDCRLFQTFFFNA
jgi:hypothetical protein